MEMTTYFRDLFAYDRWANAKIMEYLAAHVEEPQTQRLLLIFAHLIANMTPWLCLLQERPVPADLNVDPDWSVAECARHLAHHQSRMTAIVNELTEADMGKVVRSLGPRGTTHEDTVAVILTNILLHGQQHRGQMEWIIEEQTGSYVNTFYMAYIRQGTKSNLSN